MIQGIAESFVPQSLLPFLGILCLTLATWMVVWRRLWQLIIVTVVLGEVVSMMWTPSMFVPFNISTIELVTFVLVAATAQLTLVLVLAVTLVRDPAEAAGPPTAPLADQVETLVIAGSPPRGGTTVG